MCNFKENMAVHYGVNAAIVAQFIWDNLKKNNYDGKVYEKEGRKWCRCSMLMMTGFYPFLSRNMVCDAIKILVEKNVIMKGRFNENKFDKTNWYTFTDYGAHQMSKTEGDTNEKNKVRRKLPIL